MTNLPLEQLSKGQRIAAKQQVEPDTKVMQGHFGCQPGLKAVQGMRALPSQSEGIEHLVIDGFNDLTQPSQPASPVFGRPAHFAALMWRADHLRTVSSLPVVMQLIASKAFVGNIDALRRSADTAQAWRGMCSCGEKSFGQRMVIATGRRKAKAGNHASWGNGGEQMQALIPANAVAPADVGLPGQPARATSLGIARGNARTVQGFIQAALCLHLLH